MTLIEAKTLLVDLRTQAEETEFKLDTAGFRELARTPYQVRLLISEALRVLERDGM